MTLACEHILCCMQFVTLMNLSLQVKGPDWSENDRSIFSVSDEMPLVGMSSPSLTLRMFKRVLDPLLCGCGHGRSDEIIPAVPVDQSRSSGSSFPKSDSSWTLCSENMYLPSIFWFLKYLLTSREKVTRFFGLKQWWYNGSCVHVKLLSHVWLFVTPWTVAHQASLSMGVSRQEYCSGLPCPPPGDFPSPTSPVVPALQADS